MLRITTQDDAGSTTLLLVGRLAGPWVAELERCWRAVYVAEKTRLIQLDLTDVTFIDETGKQLLRSVVRYQTQLTGVGLMVQSIIEEITPSHDEQS